MKSRVLEDPDLFDPKIFSWSSLLDLTNDGLVRALEVWLLYTEQPFFQTEIISLNKLIDSLGIEILEL